MKKLFSMMLMAAAMLTACDESAKPGDGDDSTPLTPEENRDKLEQIALEAMDLASPDKQADLIQIIDEFTKITDEYYLDLRYDDSDPAQRSLSAAAMCNSLLQPVKGFAKTGNLSALTKATIESNYYYEAARAYGIYEFKTNEWVYTESTDRFSVIFPYQGSDVTLTVKTSGEEYSYVYTDEWTDYYYEFDPTTGGSVKVPTDDHIDNYRITAPAKVEASLVWGSTELMNLEVEGEYNVGEAINQTMTLKLGAYDISRIISLTNSKLSLTEDFKIDGKHFQSYQVSVTGNNLCDDDTYKNMETPEDIVTGATVSASVLDLNIKAEVTGNVKEVVTDLRNLEESCTWEDDPNELEPESNLPPDWASEKYIESQCNIVNSALSITASYGNATPFADLMTKSMYSTQMGFYDDYSYTDSWGYTYHTSQWHEFSGYYVDFIIKFRNDGGEYKISDYFNENDFASVIDAAERLVDRFEYYMDYTLAN